MKETAAPYTFLVTEEYIGRRSFWMRGLSKADAIKRWTKMRAMPEPLTDEIIQVVDVSSTPYVPGVERKAKPKPAAKRYREPV